jgi:hypothetical protein
MNSAQSLCVYGANAWRGRTGFVSLALTFLIYLKRRSSPFPPYGKITRRPVGGAGGAGTAMVPSELAAKAPEAFALRTRKWLVLPGDKPAIVIL